VGEEIEIGALRIPGWTVSIEHVIGDFGNSAVGWVPNADRRVAIRIVVVTESKKISTRRPGVVADLSMRSVGDLGHLLVRKGNDVKLSVLVGESDALSVRRPLRLVTHRRAAARDLFGGLQAVLLNNVKLFFAAH